MTTDSPDLRTPRRHARAAAVALALLLFAGPALAQDAPPAGQPKKGGGEANLVLPDLNKAEFVGGIGGKNLLYLGLVVSAAGLAFGLVVYNQLKNMAVHRTMLEVSELIYETCKTYLFTQGKFLFVLWLFIGAIIAVYFGYLTTYTDPVTGVSQHGFPPGRVGIILAFSVIGILGSYGVAWTTGSCTPSSTKVMRATPVTP